MKLKESLIQKAVVDHWRAFGVPGTQLFAIPNAYAHGQAGLKQGVFDLCIIGPQFGKVRFMELKAAGGKLSDHQKSFRDYLASAGVDFAVCYGRDDPIIALEAWGVCRPVKRGGCGND
jgi:hypothetical protein